MMIDIFTHPVDNLRHKVRGHYSLYMQHWYITSHLKLHSWQIMASASATADRCTGGGVYSGWLMK